MTIEISNNRVYHIYRHYRHKLSSIYPSEEASTIARMVMQEILGIDQIKFLSEPDLRISESEILKIHFAFKDLLNHRPLQYVLGYAWFRNIRLKVGHGVLIPRPETEELVGWILEIFLDKPNLRILDIGTGSGCIAISLAKELKGAQITATDISEMALEYARENASEHGTAIQFVLHDITSNAKSTQFEPFHVIVSNPPYVTQSEKSNMHPNVLRYEPTEALFVNNEDPFIFYRSIAGYGQKFLDEDGWIYVEINERFPAMIQKIFSSHKYRNIETRKDFNGKYRMMRAQKPE